MPIRYFAACCPGLEDILAQEIAQKLAGQVAAVRRGQVEFTCDRLVPEALGCADNLYRVLGRFYVGPHKADLPELAAEVADLAAADQLGDAPGLKAHVSCARSGRHSYSRFDAAGAALEGLCGGGAYLPGDAEDHQRAFRLDIRDSMGLFSHKLTDAYYRFRGQRAFQSAALRPTVAHAMVRALPPREGARFVDPFAGSGTIAAERAAYPAASIVAGDNNPEAVAAMGANLPDGATARQWDARRLPLADGSVDEIATNPPWGKQIASEDLPGLYRDFFAEAARVLAPDGVMVMITDQDVAPWAGAFSHSTVAELSLHGTRCAIHRFTRT